MNQNDLMNALSGLDPKYIDEAAFELHGKPTTQPAQTVKFDAARMDAAKKARLRRNLLIALPAAAAAFLLIAVAVVFPTLSRLGKSDSASMAESAAPAPAYEDSAAEAPSYAAEAAAEPESAYEAEEPMMNEAVTEAAGAAKSADAVESAAEAPASEESGTSDALGLWEVACMHDTLFVSMHGTLQEPVEEIKYTITGTDDGGLETTYAEGTLGDILLERDPLTLDIEAFKLDAGTYTLTIDGESIEFEVE